MTKQLLFYKKDFTQKPGSTLTLLGDRAPRQRARDLVTSTGFCYYAPGRATGGTERRTGSTAPPTSRLRGLGEGEGIPASGIPVM